MATAKVAFHHIDVDTQDYETFEHSDNHMVAKVYFTLTVDGRQYDDMQVEVRQPYGTRYEQDPVEVTRPKGTYKGNWNHHAFADAVEGYYRQAFGGNARLVNVSGSSDVRMRNVRFGIKGTAEFDIPD